MDKVTTINMSPTLQKSLSARMLAIETPHLIHGLAAVRETKEMHMGNKIVFQRMEKLEAKLVPISATCDTPPSDLPTRTDITAEMKVYGGWIKTTKLVELQDQNKPLNQFVRLQGIQLRETEDILTREMLASTAALVTCVDGFNGRAIA